ncbi:hypothetical protein HYFRA_00011051 [Hymenoscyphus fraxineus]|uniref:Cytochrome P450 n=1 Tax=Hymenoscyphus fraxineus TaxID=746836 RepID=A0A9N9L3D1_9HELO|nr:hypothetical protein HYFRA_00011051 [Hymenoscyphus fraxineus]
MPAIPTALATVAIVIFGSLHLFLHYSQASKEPPLIPTLFPFLGTIVGLTRKKSRYYVETSKKHNLPIYTLRLPGARLYVVNSTSLIPVVQRQYKTLAFPPIEAHASMRLCATSKIANEILGTNVNGEEGNWGFSMTFYKTILAPLAPGPDLDAMNRVMAQKVTDSMSRLYAHQKGEKVVRLFDFIKHEITLATTDSVYGPSNPFKDPRIEKAFWDFQPGIMLMIMELFPSVLARESVAGRELMVKAFVQYFEEGGHNQGSALVRARFEHSTEHKIPIEDIARFETGGALAVLSNTAPSTFWMAYHLYSDPVALEDCRQELSKIITTEEKNGVKIHLLDMSQVKTSCPILLSALQEVLRLHTVGISTRMVMEDHLLDGKYLLKKGGTVMIPGPVQHNNPENWGSNVDDFYHRRFLPESKRRSPIAFRGFGGGTTLCPGRHFASTEILAFTAMMILRFDITPVGGKWTRLTSDKAELWETTPNPDQDIEVKMGPRATEEEDVTWRILVSDSDKAMPISAEDM